MNKATERALERFPVHEGASKEWIEKHLKGVCAEYIEGYHQAEKDLELTLEDVEIILNAFLDFWAENLEQGKTKRFTDKDWCQEVLKRFKERKEKWI